MESLFFLYFMWILGPSSGHPSVWQVFYLLRHLLTPPVFISHNPVCAVHLGMRNFEYVWIWVHCTKEEARGRPWGLSSGVLQT